MSMAVIQQLKKRLDALERKEAETRKKLQRAMKDARKLAKVYQSKWLAAEKKGRKLASAVVKMEKEKIARFVKKVAKKARKSATVAKIKKKLKQI